MNRMYYDYLKREIDNMAIFYQHLRLQTAGTLFKCNCPFHQEKTASFVVYPPGHRNHNDIQEFASFYCFGCGVGGDIIKFYQLINNLNSYQEAARAIAKEYKLKQPDENEIQKEYIKNIQQTNEKLFTIDEINLSCSRRLKDAGLEQYFEWLDNRLSECNTEEAQVIFKETEEIIRVNLL